MMRKKYNPNILLPWSVLDIYANTNFFGYYLYKDEYDDDVANNHLYFLGPLVKLYCYINVLIYKIHENMRCLGLPICDTVFLFV